VITIPTKRAIIRRDASYPGEPCLKRVTLWNSSAVQPRATIPRGPASLNVDVLLRSAVVRSAGSERDRGYRRRARYVATEAQSLRGSVSATGEPPNRTMTPSVPWDEVGDVMGSRLVARASEVTRQFEKAAPATSEIHHERWQYEVCLFYMFWTWYVANSPKLTKKNATKPLLDHYYTACYHAMTNAGLVTEATYARWQSDIEARFLAYKQAFERDDPTGLRIYSGTVGHTFLRFLEPQKEPSGLAIIITEVGSIIFQELAQYIERLEQT
jgi:hypothetical protein